MRRTARALAPALLTALLLSACAGDPDATAPEAAPPAGAEDGDPSAPTPADDGASAAPAEAPGEAPDEAPGEGADGPLAFTAPTVAGDDLDVAAVAADGPVLLWFWAPWCTICRAEAPHVADVADQLEGEVTVLGVAGLGPREDMAAFVEQTGTEGFTHLADDDGDIWQRFGVIAQPAYAFVTADGEVEVVAGALGAAELAERAGALADD